MLKWASFIATKAVNMSHPSYESVSSLTGKKQEPEKYDTGNILTAHL